MSADNNLLFGVRALQAGLIDANQFVTACAAWSRQPTAELGKLLIELSWLSATDMAAVQRLIDDSPLSETPHRVMEIDSQELLELTHVCPVSAAVLAAPPSRPNRRCADGAPRPVRMPEFSQRFTVTHPHASGGIGQVWLAHDTTLDRTVALKELRADLGNNPTLWARFIQEARITGQLEHPGIVPIYELGQRSDTGQPFYAMRFVKGRTLSEAARVYQHNRETEQAEPLELLQLLNAFVAVCNTVAYAHLRGVIHRDLKGSNVIVGDYGEVIVLDWGLAKVVDRPDGENGKDVTSQPQRPMDASQTIPGQTLGTPAYMAPEQAAGRPDLIDQRTDVYGLGTILYEILTGHAPFTADSVPEVLRKVREEKPIRPRNLCSAVPFELEAICLRALSKNPTRRYSGASELGQQVQHWLAEVAELPLKQMAASERQAKEALQRAQHQQRALIDMIRSPAFQSQDLESTFQHMTEVAARTLGVQRVSIWRYNQDRSAICCAELYELGANRHSSGMELRADAYPGYFQALATSEVIAADDACRDPRTCEFTDDYLAELGISSMLDAPIHLFGEMDGVLCHEHVGQVRRWTAEEQLFGIAISNLVSLCIEQWERKRAEAALQQTSLELAQSNQQLERLTLRVEG